MQNHEKWAKELASLRTILMKTGLNVSIKWGAEVFCYQGKNVVSYGGFKNYFSLWFFNGVFLSDPYNLLVNAQEGKTKALRQWRFSRMEEIDEAKILEYVKEAIQHEKEGRVWKKEKMAMPEMPDILKNALDQDSTLKASFDQLPTYKQKEYVEFIASAARDITRLSRLHKAAALIREGKGLNDRYS